MISSLISFKNVKADFFGAPLIVSNVKPDDLAELYSQAVWNWPKDNLISATDCVLYCVGTFESSNGAIMPANDYVMDMSDLCKKVLKKRFNIELTEVVTDGQGA